MKTGSFAVVKTCVICLVTIGIAWFGFSKILFRSGTSAQQVSGFPGGLEGSIAQSHEVLRVYREANWDWKQIPQHLLLLTDEAAIPNPNPKSRWRKSFQFAGFPTVDEIAFVSPFYVNVAVDPNHGIEGTSTRTGVYIVAFRNGNISLVSALQRRIVWYQDGIERVGLEVFPGMRDWNRATKDGDPIPVDLPPLPEHVQLPNI